jgi:protease II
LKKQKARAAVIAALLALALAGAGYGTYRWMAGRDEPAVSFQSAKFTRLTTMGEVIGVSVSPDRRYVAHVIDDGGQQSLWVRQTAEPSGVQIVPPAAGASYRGFTFSPDGNFVYYTVSEKDDRRDMLHQVPVLGGASRKLLARQ